MKFSFLRLLIFIALLAFAFSCYPIGLVVFKGLELRVDPAYPVFGCVGPTVAGLVAYIFAGILLAVLWLTWDMAGDLEQWIRKSPKPLSLAGADPIPVTPNSLPEENGTIFVLRRPRKGYENRWQTVFYDADEKDVSAEEWSGPILELCSHWMPESILPDPKQLIEEADE